MPSHSSYCEKPSQIIEGQYLDQQILMSLLKNVYGISEEGKNNFRVEVRYCHHKMDYFTNHLNDQLRLNRYKIYPAEHIGESSGLTQVSAPRRTLLAIIRN